MRARYGHHFLRVGLVGFAVLALAFALTAFSMANGVHCLGCDRYRLSEPEFVFWSRYFVVKDGAYLGALVLLAIASPFAAPRRWPFVFGVALALFAFGLTPM